MLTLPQLLQIPNVYSGLRFTISPDEECIVFSWNKSGKWELWEIKGGEIRELESSIQGAKFSPQFSPDGTMLAYALDIDGSESYHIVVFNLEINDNIDLSFRIAYAHQPNISWSPDGKTLAVLSDMKGQFALYTLPIDGSPARLKKNVFRPCWDAVWSPDGQWIALEAESTASNRSIYLVPANRPHKGIKAHTIQLKINDEVLNAQHPAWSTDSKQLAFSCQNGEWFNIGVFNVDSQEITWLTDSIGDDTHPTWAKDKDGESAGWIHAIGAQTRFEMRDGRGVVREYQIGTGVHSFPQFVSDGVILLYEDANRPSDLWKINLSDGSKIQLTKSLDEELDFVQPEEVWYAGKDGAQVPALLYRAKDSKRAVIDIHGGPNWNLQFSWNPVLSYMVSRGWTVLAPNYRGSTGYGKKWQNASRFDMGGVDTDDCAAGVNYLIENGLAEKNKIAVTGRSHGGYLTMTCLTEYPELFAGGSAVVPFLNWIKSHKESREDLQHWNIENMGDPETNRELWVARSPYFFLDKISAPVQMICGGNDPRCPASDSIEARDKLLELGKEVELLIYKDEGHSFLKTENVIDSDMKCIEFLIKVLEN